MTHELSNFWKKCSNCKKELALGSTYWSCSVSTCNKKRAPMVFCSVTCFDVHIPVMGHKSAWAEENKAPLQREEANEGKGKRILIKSTPSAAKSSSNDFDEDILIVASKFKKYIRDRSEMNTSGNVMEALSHIVRRLGDRAIESARNDGRKTVMDRDFTFFDNVSF